ncbi:hypothetical protein Ade02nite_04750 [Paractinoplanes deccanensis]|uniref:Integral membrane protein n=1 Tax=Paractinoplanes deccanensis TaxID=113561 RepID=A0ABQ3XVR9_9ACTN|nr:hypothetical protein [Actinoplanes deccanensis]GID71834.1 hypothetical protein Ade02nite_04750 [Actinoplanes deccanensis]
MRLLPVSYGSLLAVGGWLVFWWLAVPRHDICAMVYPAPAGCGADRVPVAALWTVVTAVLYGIVLFSAGRPRRRRPGTLALTGLTITAPCGYVSVLYA